MSDVYEDILNEAASWTAVARPDGQDGWTDSSAPIRLVEQDPRGGLTPLFAAVAEALFNRPVIAAVVALFDNYNPFEGQPDVQLSDLEHSQEIEALLADVPIFEGLPTASRSAICAISETLPSPCGPTAVTTIAYGWWPTSATRS